MRRIVLLLAAIAACGPGGGGSSSSKSKDDMDDGVDRSAELFDENQFNDIHLSMSPEDWQSLIDDNRGDEYRVCTIQWKSDVVENTGVRPSGEFSRFAGNTKPSLRLDFNTFVLGQRFLGLKSLKLDGLSRDGSFIRDRVAYGIYRGRIVAPRSVHCRLFVNGEYRGVYEIEERIDSTFVKRRFGGEVGNVYKMISSDRDQYLDIGQDEGFYVPFPWELKTNEEAPDNSPVLRFVDMLSHRPNELSTMCDVDRLLWYLAGEAVIDNGDGLCGDFGGGNHYQYYRFEDGLFHVIPWDLNGAWSDEVQRSIWQNFDEHTITRIVELDQALRDGYKSRIGQLLDSEGSPATIEARIDFIYAQIRDAVYADPYKPFDNGYFDDSMPYIKQFAVERHDYLRVQIAMP